MCVAAKGRSRMMTSKMALVVALISLVSCAFASRLHTTSEVDDRVGRTLLQTAAGANPASDTTKFPNGRRVLLTKALNRSTCLGRTNVTLPFANTGTDDSAQPGDCPRDLNTANSFILVLVNDGDGMRLQDATNTSMCLDADGEYIAVFTPCADTDTQRFQIRVVNDTTDQVTVALVNMRYKTYCLKNFNVTNSVSTPPFFYWDEEACTADPFVWEVETECTNVPGYTVIPYADSTAQPNLRVNGLPPKPPFLPTLPYLLSLANICAQDCRCTHITSYGAGKSLGPLAPLNAAGWNRCLYQRTTRASCCPDVPGYNKTEGIVADWGVYKSLDPLVPGSQQPSAANQPWTVGMITPLANTCAGDCQCVAFSNDVSPNLYNDTYLTAPIDPTVIRAATTDRCIYTASPPVCASDPALYASRIRFRNALKWPDRCIFNENGVVGFSMGNPEYCPSDKTSAFKLVPADDGSGAATIREDGGRCLGVTQVKGKPATLLGPLQVQNCVPGAPHQQFLIRKIDDGRYEIVAYTDRTKCLVADDFAPDGVVVMGTCGVGDLDMQRFQIDVETACPLMDGYDAVGARTLRRALKNFLEVSDSKDRDTVAKECMTNCKCMAFSFVTGAIPRNGILWTSNEFPEFTAGVGECYYMKQQITPCTCPAVTSFNFRVAVDGPSTGNIMTLDPVPSIPEIGGACLADCKCNSFNSNGVLKTTITSSPVADRGLCFYSRIGTPDCSVKCPETNLACLTTKLPALQLPKFPVNLPQLPYPDNSGDVLDTLDPPTLVTYVAKFASGSGGGDLTSRFGCPGALLPIFKGSSIGDNKALDTLSGGACGKMKPLPDNSYIVGAISTAAADFVTSLGGLKADKANKAKKDGKDYGICAAVDPCSRDLHLGFVGLSVKLGLGLGPLTPPTLTITLKSVSYSDSGNGAGIAKTSLGLWTYNDKVDTVNNGVAIMGNVYMSVGAVLTWGFQAGSVKVCTITLSADVQIVTRSHNPTRFAMQIAAKPTIDLFPGGGFIVDLKKVVDSLSIDVLFYVEHYNDNKYNVYVAVNVRSDLQTLLSAFAGPLGQVLKELVSSQSNLNVLMNIHMDPRGAGIRLYFTGQIALGGKIGGFITKFIPQAKITFTAGLGAKLSIVQVKGRKKVFGSVFIQGNEFSFAPCSDNLDCMSDQVCYTGFCAKKMGCLATRPIDIGDTLGSAFGGLFSSGGPKVKTCPKGLDNFNGLFCRVRNCPKDFPQFCNNGIFGSCVKLGVECSFDKILASLFGNCPGI